MSKIKLAILEPSRSINQLKNYYTEVFGALGYELEIIVLDGATNDIECDYGVFENNMIDVFVSDLSLGKIESYDGLIVIKKIKKKYPNLLVIANSNTNVTFADTVQQIPSFDLFIYKPKMRDRKYKNFIIERIGMLFKRNVYLERFVFNIENTELIDDYMKIKDMLRVITFASHKSNKHNAVTAVELKKMKGGYSGSEVYKMEAFAEGGLKCINSVFKLSKISLYIEEKDNYLSYIKWYLPYTWRPELIGFAESTDIGAMCYSFAYNNEVSFMSLGELLELGHYAKLDVVIDKVFSPNMQRWYHKKNVKIESALTDYYFEKWFDGRDFDDQIFCKIVADISKRNNNYIEVDDIKYPMPSGYLLGKHVDKYNSCICHGDLNANNILVSENNDITFIDFQKTKRGHVFDDFVTLEGSVRMSINYNMPFKDNIGIEYAQIIGDEDMIQKYANSSAMHIEELYAMFGKMRKYAFDNIPEEDTRNYYYALALYCLRLLRINDLHLWQKYQITSCLLSCERFLYDNKYL